MQSSSRAACAVVLACSWFIAGPGQAGVRSVAPGQASLAAGEGFIALVIDSDMPLEYAELKAVGGLAGEQIKQIGVGRRLAILAAPAGAYRYGKVQWGSGITSRTYWNLSDEAAHRCTIEAGALNYCGDLRIRHAGGNRAVFARRNRAAAAMEMIDRDYPALRERYPLRYRGQYDDPYPDWIAALERDVGAAAKPDLPALPRNATTGVPDATTMFTAERVASMRINPSGSLLVETGHLGFERLVTVIDVASGQSTEIHRGAEEPLSAQWAGESVLALSFDAPGALGTNVVVVKLTHVPGQPPVAHAMAVPDTGWLVDPVPSDDRHILFSRYDVNRGYGLYRLDISGRSIARTQFEKRRRVGEHVDSAAAWLVDARGEIETMIQASDDGLVVRRRQGDGLVRIATVASDERFVPVGTDEDGALLVLTDRGREFVELARYEPGGPLETVLAADGADLVSVERDSSRGVIGARYYQDGRLRTKYRDRARMRSQSALEKAFAGAQVVVVDTSRAGQKSVLFVEGPSTAPAYYLHDRARRSVELLGQVYPALEDVQFVAPERLVVRTPDGLDIEAFLYIPHGEGPHPLVVMPHGGPIGVFDAQHFDHEVQFLAVRGYAVLQVNFRGSGGKGKALRDAGLRAAGSRIEDDVMLALDRAVEHSRIDPDRVCILGSSYGGYSALRSTLRWPERFRCAVSIAGPTDLALQFTGSDAVDDDRVIATLGKWFGDPVRDAVELRSRSPLYADRPIEKPVLLIHGAEDDRVPLEHALRFKRSMALRGRPIRLVTLPHEAHGFRRLDSSIVAWNAIDRFLAAHLRAGP